MCRRAGGWAVLAHNAAERSEDYYRQPRQLLKTALRTKAPKQV